MMVRTPSWALGCGAQISALLFSTSQILYMLFCVGTVNKTGLMIVQIHRAIMDSVREFLQRLECTEQRLTLDPNSARDSLGKGFVCAWLNQLQAHT